MLVFVLNTFEYTPFGRSGSDIAGFRFKPVVFNNERAFPVKMGRFHHPASVAMLRTDVFATSDYHTPTSVLVAKVLPLLAWTSLDDIALVGYMFEGTAFAAASNAFPDGMRTTDVGWTAALLFVILLYMAREVLTRASVLEIRTSSHAFCVAGVAMVVLAAFSTFLLAFDRRVCCVTAVLAMFLGESGDIQWREKFVGLAKVFGKSGDDRRDSCILFDQI